MMAFTANPAINNLIFMFFIIVAAQNDGFKIQNSVSLHSVIGLVSVGTISPGMKDRQGGD